MEEDVKNLLELLGYSILRENLIKYPGIDKIAKFIGVPKPTPPNPCSLQKPIYSPNGYIAISIKKGDFTISDINKFLEDIKEARQDEEDDPLKNIEGGLIISNFVKLPSEINEIKKKGVYCWDLVRLMFYASKARNAKILSKFGSVRENIIDLEDIKATYLRQWQTNLASDNTLPLKILIFIDEHESEFIYSADHNKRVLEYIYNKEIKTMIDERDINVDAQFEIHVLGKANPDLVRKSYLDFSREHLKQNESQLGTKFAAEIPIFQYSISPWSILIY